MLGPKHTENGTIRDEKKYSRFSVPGGKIVGFCRSRFSLMQFFPFYFSIAAGGQNNTGKKAFGKKRELVLRYW